VDLNSGVLTILQSKFGKSRLVPLHPSAVDALARYRAQRGRHLPTTPDTPFFITTRGRLLGQPVSDRQAHRIFEQLRRQLGWGDRGNHGRPRVHDMRHSFSVRRLLQWHEQGVDINQRMLALSTYLGHAKVSNTYWYLTGVPELMSLVGKRFEYFADPWENGDE
jgi:integrase